MNTKGIYELYKQSYTISTDSRHITPKCLYFAFRGEHFNGNEWAAEAKDKGALACFVEQEEFADSQKGIYYVQSSLESLQKLAMYHRQQLSIPVIGLTGSNGKTTTKELIAAVISQKFKTLFTAGNYNNHLGVPLTLLRIDPTYEMAIIEMGANHQKEIESLCQIAQPDIGYITNFGSAHLEGFGGREGVIKGKSELYEYLLYNDRTVLCNDADPLQVQQSSKISKRIRFGTPESDYYFILEKAQHNQLVLSYKGTELKTQLTGDYNFSNACAAVSLGLYFEVDISAVQQAIANYTPENQRSQIISKHQQTIVLDAYNANPSSMQSAIENFDTFEGSKTSILGDMFELGEFSESEHRSIIEEVLAKNWNQAIFVGEHFYNQKTEGAQFYRLREELEKKLQSEKINSKNILIKGSRGMALENIVKLL